MPTRINATISIGTRGKAEGTTSNAQMQTPIPIGVNASFSSTLTGGSKITTAYGPTSAGLGSIGKYSIAASGNLTVDLQAFESILNESSQSISKARIFILSHESSSTASSIVVGNAASNQWTFMGLSSATATLTLRPGDFIAFGSSSSAGMAVSGTSKSLKVLNSDASNAAIIRIFIAGDA
jgi:hypothetical protein